MKRFFSLLITAVFIMSTVFMSNRLIPFYTEPAKLDVTEKSERYKQRKK